MRIDEESFQVVYDLETKTVSFFGSLRMNELAEFDKIKKFMKEAYELDDLQLMFDFKKLEFMNSAGISTLCKFIFDIKDLTPYKPVIIVGNANILWQRKSFENLKKIWDKLTIRFDDEKPKA
ncbi:MAG: hypothetical protein A2Y38_18320 [Spirochaetes bacterium GWB1_59_5]|nr:MAG: hypothetical protein A2Y38_18320 [Spirochaetes bacterium GWB1_59_5]